MSSQWKPEKHSFSGNWQEWTKMEEKQTLPVKQKEAETIPAAKSLYSVLFALTYMYMVYFSLSIAIHSGLEKNTKLILWGVNTCRPCCKYSSAALLFWGSAYILEESSMSQLPLVLRNSAFSRRSIQFLSWQPASPGSSSTFYSVRSRKLFLFNNA